MSETEPLARDPGGHATDARAATERHNATLASILDETLTFHGTRSLADLPALLGAAITRVFPGARFLVVTRTTEGDHPFRIAATNFDADRVERARRVCNEVAQSGVPSYGAVENGDPSSCVAMGTKARTTGSCLVEYPRTELRPEELCAYLRTLAAHAGAALANALAVKERSEMLEVISDELGADVTKDPVSLSAAKRAFERWLIRGRLNEHTGNIAAAARSLLMDRGQLSRLVKRHKIDKTTYKAHRGQEG